MMSERGEEIRTSAGKKETMRQGAAESGGESRIAMISIILNNTDGVSRMNEILHGYASYIIGRMGIPYREKGLCLISVAIDAPLSVTSALTGQIGRIPGISVKTAYAKADRREKAPEAEGDAEKAPEAEGDAEKAPEADGN